MRWAIGGAVAILFFYSLHLAVHRIIQVDEAQNLYMARVIASGQIDAYFVHPELFLLGPIAWIAKSATSAGQAILSSRLLFAAVFWLNIFLIVGCTGERLRTKEGLLAALGAATLAPLWDYGFEVRHDNLVLTGLLLIWYLGRHRADATSSYFAIGALSAILQFTAFKAFAYTIPLSLYLLICRGVSQPALSPRTITAWLAGAVMTGLACLAVFWHFDLLPILVENTATLAEGNRSTAFYPFETLSRLLYQTPLVVAVATAALITATIVVLQSPNAMFRDRDWVPEATLVSISLVVLFINPTPFPYNLVCVVPFAYLLAYRLLRQTLPAVSANRTLILIAVCIVGFTHVLPFIHATQRHLAFTNWRQMKLADTAEAMTDAATDPVYDAAGLVLTRHSIGQVWYLHSLNVARFYDSKTSVTAMLATNPAAVLMPNYRFDWLPKSDWEFIRENYLPLADDFWVLGTRLPPGGGDIRTLRSGRYQIESVDDQRGLRPELTLDGTRLTSKTVTLTAGAHNVKATDHAPVIVVWLGPRLKSVPQMTPGNHRTIFRNWY